MDKEELEEMSMANVDKVLSALQSIISLEKGATHPNCIYKSPKNPQDPCYQYFYKKAEDVPESVFEELGLKKGTGNEKKHIYKGGKSEE